LLIYAIVASGTALLATEGSEPLLLLEWLADFADVFDTEKAGELPAHSKHKHAIEIEGEGDPLYGPLYNLSIKELRTLREYLDDALAKG
jgi:hypothetical protein